MALLTRTGTRRSVTLPDRFGGGYSPASLLAGVVTTITGGRCSAGWEQPAVVRTIALKEDAQPALAGCGDDAPWRRMLGPACRAMVTTIAWRTMLPEVYLGVVRTIALKEDAPIALAIGGDDAPWRRMLRGWEQPRW